MKLKIGICITINLTTLIKFLLVAGKLQLNLNITNNIAKIYGEENGTAYYISL